MNSLLELHVLRSAAYTKEALDELLILSRADAIIILSYTVPPQ